MFHHRLSRVRRVLPAISLSASIFALSLLTPSSAAAQPTHSRVLVPSANGGSVQIIDTSTNTVAPTIWIPDASTAAANPKNRYFYVVTAEAPTKLLRRSFGYPQFADTEVDLGLDPGVTGDLRMAISPDGKKAWITSWAEDKIAVVDLDTMTVDTTITTITRPLHVAVSATGAAYVVSQLPDLLNRIDPDTYIVDDFVALPAASNGLALSPDDETAYVAVSANNQLVAVNTMTMTFGPPLTVGTTPIGVAITPDGARVLVTNQNSSNMSIVDTAAWTVEATIAVGSLPQSVAVTPLGDHAYVTNRGSNNVSVISLGVTPAFVQNVAAGNLSDNYTSAFISPLMLGPNQPTLNVGSDADLTAVGFTDYFTVAGGTVLFSADTTITKRLEVVGPGISELNTNGFNVTLAGDSDGDSAISFQKLGLGRLTMAGTHVSHMTRAYEGHLVVTGTHLGDVMVGGLDTIVGGTGYIEDLGINSGTVAPGLDGTGSGVLYVDTLLMGSGTRFRVRLLGTTPGSYGRVEVADHAGFINTELVVTADFVPALDTEFIILTNAEDKFLNLPEGAYIASGNLTFRISYVGGDGNDVTLTVSNRPPDLSALQNQTVDEDAAASQIALTVDDIDDPVNSLVVTADSSNPALFAPGSLTVTGAGMNRTLSFTPAPNAHGTATITVRVADSVQFTERSFLVTVNSVNDDPTIEPIAAQSIMQDTSLAPVSFGIADVDIDDPVTGLTITLTSSNQTLLPDANLAAGGTGATRTVAATPVVGQHGLTTITVTVSDGEDSASTTFTLTVMPNSIDYSFAEGATGGFFDTDILLANPNATAAPVTITFAKEDGSTVVETRELAPFSRMTLRADQIGGLEEAAFSTVVTSTIGLPLAVERTMRWDASGYGASTEKASVGESTTWLFAEGAQGYFWTYLLLANPLPTANVAHVTWLREGETPVTRDYPIQPSSRLTVDTGLDADLQNRSFGATVTFDQPGMAERAMYFGMNPVWAGGHAAAGATAPSTTWYLAEGASGSFFTTYVLVANPGTEPANVTLTYYVENGAPVSVDTTLAPGQRISRNVAFEDASLANASFATRVTASQPVVVERALYWGAPAWIESHNSLGVSTPSRRWALAEGRAGGTDGAQTYILLANFGDHAANVTLTFLRESGSPETRMVEVPAGGRVTVGLTGDAGSAVPELNGEAFGTLIESTADIVVERSFYTNANGVIWAAGTNATGTPLPLPR